MFLLKIILWRTSIERPNFNFSATCRYPRGWPRNRSSTVIPKTSFFLFILCVYKYKPSPAILAALSSFHALQWWRWFFYALFIHSLLRGCANDWPETKSTRYKRIWLAVEIPWSRIGECVNTQRNFRLALPAREFYFNQAKRKYSLISQTIFLYRCYIIILSLLTFIIG